MGKISVCPKDIGFENIFWNFLWEKKKYQIILTVFYISH